MVEGWRIAVVYYQGGIPLGYQIGAPYPADAGPPTLGIDPLGDLYLAWSGLEDTTPHLYTATTDGFGLLGVPSRRDGDFLESIGTGLARMPFGLLWLVIPTCAVMIAPHSRGTVPLAGILYGAAKLLWPSDLFVQSPVVLGTIGFDRFRPEFPVGLAAAIIGLLAAGVFAMLCRLKRPVWQSWLAYALTDVVFTWAVFGANPEILSHHLP
jgi:hypothetical protein